MCCVFGHDVRFAIRGLRKNPAAFAVIVLALALGIAVNAVVFSLVDSILFKRLPGKDPERLVRLFSVNQKNSNQLQPTAFPIYMQDRDAMKGFVDLAAYRNVRVQFSTTGGEGRQIYAAVVTGNFFPVLNLGAEKGRVFSSEDDGARGANPVAVLSDRLWRGLDSQDVIGSSIRVNGQSYTVVGIAPPALRDFDHVPELWLPMSMATEADPVLATQMDRMTNPFFFVLGRLAGNISLPQAQAKLDAVDSALGAGQTIHLIEGMEGEQIAASSALQSAQTNDETVEWQRPGAVLRIARKNFSENDVRLSWLLFGIASLVLLIACVDVAGLLAARSAQRQKETAIRLALGASRMQLFRQRFLEGVLLAIAGSGVGMLLAASAERWLLASAPSSLLPASVEAGSVVNFRLLLFVSAISFMVAVGFSLITTWREADRTFLDSLKGEHSQPSTHLTRQMPAQALWVVFQIAASFILLSGAGLLLRTLQQAARVDLGFSTDHLLTASLDLSRQGYDKTRAAAMPGPILENLKEISGVESAALSMGPLLNSQPYQSSSKYSAKADCSNLDIVPVTPGYFSTLQIPFLRGRDFSPRDHKNAPGVVIANQAAASLCWPGKDLIGEHLSSVKTRQEPFEVIGLVGNVKNAAGEENPKPLLYVSLPQFYEAFPFQMTLGIVVRTKLEPHEIMPSLISAIRRLDGNLALNDIETPQETLAQEFSEQNFLSTLLLTFGAMALVLALAGLYGLLSYLTAKRTREFGIRLALGARREDVLYLVLQQGGQLVFGSVFIGVFGAIASAHLLRNFLFGVEGADPLTYFTIAAFVLLVGVAACSLPARRATRVDPVVALRDE
jgi:predicted permease